MKRKVLKKDNLVDLDAYFPGCLTLKEASVKFGFSEAHLMRLIGAGSLKAFKYDGHWLTNEAWFKDYLNKFKKGLDDELEIARKSDDHHLNHHVFSDSKVKSVAFKSRSGNKKIVKDKIIKNKIKARPEKKGRDYQFSFLAGIATVAILGIGLSLGRDIGKTIIIEGEMIKTASIDFQSGLNRGTSLVLEKFSNGKINDELLTDKIRGALFLRNGEVAGESESLK